MGPEDPSGVQLSGDGPSSISVHYRLFRRLRCDRPSLEQGQNVIDTLESVQWIGETQRQWSRRFTSTTNLDETPDSFLNLLDYLHFTNLTPDYPSFEGKLVTIGM